MKDLAIYGAGGCGREVACLIRRINRIESTWNFVGFFDDGKKVGDFNEYGRIIGGLNELNDWSRPLSIVIAIGSTKIVSSLIRSMTNSMLDFPSIISPDAILVDEQSMIMGKGNIVFARSIISCNVHIGDFNIFNSMIAIGHDTVIGHCNIFMPAALISGEVTIGNENTFGVSSVILQQIQIGNHTIIGANSLIIRKTQDDHTYMGIPATIVHY